jgi:hypothetical protein
MSAFLRRAVPCCVAVAGFVAACGSSDTSTGGAGPGASGGVTFGGSAGIFGQGGTPFGGAFASGGVVSAGRVGSGGASAGGVLGSGGAPSSGGALSAGGAEALDGGTSSGGAPIDGGAAPSDPGTGPWVPVPSDRVLDECHLDPAALAAADAKLNTAWAIVRYGKLCHEFMSATYVPAEAWSTTKTLGAVVSGVVAYQTKNIPVTGPKTGPFSDVDRADHWLDSVTYNPEAHVAHVLAMVAQNADLSLGKKTMSYDIIGTVQINSLSDMLNAAIAQDTTRFGADLEQFTQKFVFGPLGMHDSTWSSGAATKVFAYSWSTTPRDMARIGLLMLNGGVWNGVRLLDEGWIYRMTHPSFEDANTGYGYLTWLNSSSNHHYGGIPGAPVGLQEGAQSPGPCAPVSVYPTHPHGLSDSPDCNYSAPYTCTQQYDDGVWQAVGLNGQVIQGHRALDAVIIARDVTPLGSGPAAPGILWDAVRPAIVNADPRFKGDDTAFCAAYGTNSYAPDLK